MLKLILQARLMLAWMAMIGMCHIKEAVTYPIVEAGDDTDK